MVTEFFVSSIKYIENNIHAEGMGAIILVTLMILAVIGFVFLLFRGISLWYWKINRQIEVLSSINQNLEEIKKQKNYIVTDVERNRKKQMTVNIGGVLNIKELDQDLDIKLEEVTQATDTSSDKENCENAVYTNKAAFSDERREESARSDKGAREEKKSYNEEELRKIIKF